MANGTRGLIVVNSAAGRMPCRGNTACLLCRRRHYRAELVSKRAGGHGPRNGGVAFRHKTQ